MMRSSLLIALLLATLVQRLPAQAHNSDLAVLQQAYATNNAEVLPLVSLMEGGTPLFLLFPDGRLIVGTPQTKRPGFTQLTDHDLQVVVSSLTQLDDFWLLSANYDLAPNVTHQPEHALTLRLPGKPEKSVAVYGALSAPFPAPVPPAAFTTMLRLLERLTPRELTPWDPGYVEVYWSDYSYAPDQSLDWPKDWPGLSSPLTRQGKAGDLIKYYLVLPSSKVAELDQLLARRPQRGAILIDGWKGSAHYRWPLPNEKRWSSWTQ